MTPSNLDRAVDRAETDISGPLEPNTLAKNAADSTSLPSIRGGDYNIRLDFFEGPLDLLLHLVQQKEVALKDVDMSDIANQYLSIVTQKQTAEIDLDLASEYLVIAATLIALKSQKLIPNSKEELDPLSTETDPEILEELRQRLIAYEVVKKQARAFSASPQLGVNTFIRRHKVQDEEEEQKDYEIKSDGNELAMLFAGLLKRIGAKLKTYKVQLEPVSVVETMMKILDSLSLTKCSSFSGLLKTFSLQKKQSLSESGKEKSGNALLSSRGIVISSFISVLELTKRGLLSVRQESKQQDIELELKMLDAEESELEEKNKILNDPELEEI